MGYSFECHNGNVLTEGLLCLVNHDGFGLFGIVEPVRRGQAGYHVTGPVERHDQSQPQQKSDPKDRGNQRVAVPVEAEPEN